MRGATALVFLGSAALLTVAVFCGPVAAEEPGAESREGEFLSRTRQLTYEGRRAGEGYFSPDGRYMVFQSEREPGNPFYQIYELDLETGETRLVSPGQGKTTCAFHHPESREILFASTHHDPRSEQLQKEELELRASGKERRYAWDYDPEMEIWAAAADGTLERLTDARGYDAEGSYSPDGQWIAFASNRDVYARELSDEESKQLETDPAFFNEIYLMRSDGSRPRRLTTTPGYDGGPFFTADGKRIVWRRFDEQGLVADLWTMNLDGTEALQVTDFGSMSWAPYPHPSGEYFLFTSNKHGFENFELFIVDVAGSRQPVRVTWTPGFDGLPVPTPDGGKLAWTTTRKSDGLGQIFLADWNHERARQALGEAPPRGAADAETAEAP